jgi:hypothetical protein
MPRYYFHVVTPNERIEDTEGQELPNLESARLEAVESLRSIISAEVRHGVLGLDEWIEVTDGAGKELLTIRGGDALKIATASDPKDSTVVSLRSVRPHKE